MKAKLFSILMLVAAVSLLGVAEAQPASDTDQKPLTEIVDVETVSAEAAIVADAEVGSELQSIVDETLQQVGSFLPSCSGDNDHQIISLQAAKHEGMTYSRYRQYRPRSNLYYLSYLA